MSLPYSTDELTTADEFIEVLTEANRGLYGEIVFRGQPQSDWSLTPSSHRASAWPPELMLDLMHFKDKRGLTVDLSRDTWGNRLYSEVANLLSFCRIADRRGLVVPNGTDLRSELMSYFLVARPRDHFDLDIIRGWPPDSALPALGLAQHYGLRTCLLDFTWNPFVAAYFAVQGCMNPNTAHLDSADTPLCVWALQDEALNPVGTLGKLRFSAPPASDNQTLQAQEGVFLWSRLDPFPNLDDDFKPRDGFESSALLTHKYTLPRSEAPNLLNRLIHLGYDASRLFPTYNGAAQALREHQWAAVRPRW